MAQKATDFVSTELSVDIAMEQRVREQIAEIRFKLHNVQNGIQFLQIPDQYLGEVIRSICTIHLVFRSRIDSVTTGLIYQFVRPEKTMAEFPGCFCSLASFLHMPVLMHDAGHRNYNPFLRPLPRRCRIAALRNYLWTITGRHLRQEALLREQHYAQAKRFDRCEKKIKIWLSSNI